MTTERSAANTTKALRLEQIRVELNQRWIEQELERVNEVFFSALKEAVEYCEQLRSELASQQLLEQETKAKLTIADKLRFKLGIPFSSASMSAAAQQLSIISERIEQLQNDILLNSPGAKASSPDTSSKLLTAIAQNDRALRLAKANNNSARSAWVEEQLQNQLIDERVQLDARRKQVSQTKADRKALRSNVELIVTIEGQRGMSTGVTRDISDTGVFIELKDADKMFIEGELLTVQVKDLPVESTAVRGVAVRVSSNGLGVRLISAKNTLRTHIENQDHSQ
ncbi:hypothetical protein PSEUDO8BK_30955 [Pseudomonas sp. 8BK]|uniref:PilZ domain-containing protein n=1 Tax=Pseudomonas sp. 8BK TaxID=2653164 RepID=UPI0012F402ED|nr:PilZ domain-containing protein [Pseudomonas sp. 8BK]VXB68072.1 hypothetical protein PSEUDO8BK_30955 [Pseudomonas sp. 8BK]